MRFCVPPATIALRYIWNSHCCPSYLVSFYWLLSAVSIFRVCMSRLACQLLHPFPWPLLPSHCSLVRTFLILPHRLLCCSSTHLSLASFRLFNVRYQRQVQVLSKLLPLHYNLVPLDSLPLSTLVVFSFHYPLPSILQYPSYKPPLLRAPCTDKTSTSSLLTSFERFSYSILHHRNLKNSVILVFT